MAGFVKNSILAEERNKRYCKEYYYSHKEERRNYKSCKRTEAINSWIGVIPQKTICQMCGKELCFGSNNQFDAIHFDHRHGGKELIENPAQWLRDHKRTPENEAIWKSCDFGMLCIDCNRRLPTKDRLQFVINVSKYLKSYT